MVSKTERLKRKAKLDELKLKEREEAEANLPMSKPELKDLFDWVDAKLGEEGCDHTLRHSILFIKERRLSEEKTVAWLREGNGYCDCEVIANVEDKWGEIVRSV